jgi:hypothetical protein
MSIASQNTPVNILQDSQSPDEEFTNLMINGAGDEIRTHDSVLGKHILYR